MAIRWRSASAHCRTPCWRDWLASRGDTLAPGGLINGPALRQAMDELRAGEEPLALCGDCNLDGSVSVLDALEAAQLAAALRLPGPGQDLTCDVDCDAAMGAPHLRVDAALANTWNGKVRKADAQAECDEDRALDVTARCRERAARGFVTDTGDPAHHVV